jgi:hypothetical protein
VTVALIEQTLFPFQGLLSRCLGSRLKFGS